MRDKPVMVCSWASSLHGLLRPPPSQNPSKISPKSVRFRICDFFNAYPPVTYNFNAVKRTDFLPVTAEMTKRTDPLRSGRIRTVLEFALHNALNSNSLRFRASGSSGSIPLAYTVQNRTKSNKIEYKCQGPSQSMPTQPELVADDVRRLTSRLDLTRASGGSPHPRPNAERQTGFVLSFAPPRLCGESGFRQNEIK